MSIRPRLGAGVPELTAQVARASNPVTFSEDTLASRTGSGPANLATIRAAVITAIKDAATCTSPKAAATTPPWPRPPAFTASIRANADIHGTRRSPGPFAQTTGSP